MNPGTPPDESRDQKPICPQCGSDDTTLIQQPPPAAASELPGPKVKEVPLYRCLTCRFKWKEGEGY